MKNRIISGLLSFIMMFTVVVGIIPPIEVHAADGGGNGLDISSPSDGDTINGFETIKIQWNKYNGADHYVLVIKDNTTGEKVFEDELSSSTRAYNVYYDDYIFTEDGHEYKIYVAARDEDGNVMDGASVWHTIYVQNELELETPELSYGYSVTHCADDDLYISWDEIDGADDYTVYIKRLNGSPDFGNDNEAGTNISYDWEDDCEISVSSSKLVAGKWYKVAICAENTDQDITSQWDISYILMEESSYLEVSEYPDDLDAEKGSTGSFWINSNLDWDISCDVSWLTWTINQVDDTHAEIIVKATSANTKTADREAEFTISADGVDDEYVYVTQLAPEIELPSFSNVKIAGNVSLGEKITWSANVNGNGSLLETVSVGIYSKQLDDSVFFRNVNIDEETYSLSGSVTTGGIVSGYDASGNAKKLDMSLAGEYTVTLHASTDAAFNNYAATNPVTITLTEPVGTGILGDVNSDGQVTNLDRFIFNRYLNSMSGYTANMVNKESADIDGDGNLTEDDSIILARHLSGWIGYEDMSVFYIGPTTPSVTDTSKWSMGFSSNAVTIDITLESGQPIADRDYRFVAEDSRGLHYTDIIEAGKTAASFRVTGLQMRRGEMYSYYVFPDGEVLSENNNKEKYCIGKCVVPLFNGNMITSVKSAGRSIAKNGNIFLGDSVTIGWDGSYGVDNFKLVVTLNGKEIFTKTYNHDGPGTAILSADMISAAGTGKLIIAGYVEPSASSGLPTAVSTWSGNVIEVETESVTEIDPVSLLNDKARTLYNKTEAVAYLQMDTYYYWQAFSDELTSGTHWGSKLENARKDISNVVNGVFSSPTTLIFDTDAKSLIKQAVRTKLLAMIGTEEQLKADLEATFDVIDPAALEELCGLQQIFLAGNNISDNDLIGIIKKIDFRSFNGAKNGEAIKKVFDNLQVVYNGKTYKLSNLFNTSEDTVESVVNMLKNTKNAKAADQADCIDIIKNTRIAEAATIKSVFKLEGMDYVQIIGKTVVHAYDMYMLKILMANFDELEDDLLKIEGGSSGVFKEAITETIDELKNSFLKQHLAETAWFAAETAVDLFWGKAVTYAAGKISPYALIATVANGVITALADTDTINKGEMTLPSIVTAMNNTISQIEYKYSLFMMAPTNARYYELEALFYTYKFQVELGAEIYLNINLSDHNSYLKRFARFVNPFDNDDNMPNEIQACYDQDIQKLNYVMNWFGFN